MRALVWAGETHEEIGRALGYSAGAVAAFCVAQGIKRPEKISPDNVDVIRGMIKAGMRQHDIARVFGVGKPCLATSVTDQVDSES